jgi:hypothetical protein
MALLGVLGADKLKSLYGVEMSDPNMLILMQHRAVLFGLIGALLILAIFKVEYRWLATIVALISAVSFLVIALLNGNYNSFLKTVINADIVAIAALLVAAVSMRLLMK